MGKLRTPEEIKASKQEETAKYLAHAEDVLSELIGQLFGPEETRVDGTEELNWIRMKGMGLRQLVMALRRYPRFDVSCLSAMKPFEFVYRRGSEDRKLNVMVPTFGVQDLYGIGSAGFELMSDRNVFKVGETPIYFDLNAQRRNTELLREERLNGDSWSFGKLQAQAPKVPVDVRRRVDESRPCFDRLTLVWEAEWGPAPVVDPLIIGSVDEYHFLVDKYDVTKLERYISSEMTRSPLK